MKNAEYVQQVADALEQRGYRISDVVLDDDPYCWIEFESGEGYSIDAVEWSAEGGWIWELGDDPIIDREEMGPSSATAEVAVVVEWLLARLRKS